MAKRRKNKISISKLEDRFEFQFLVPMDINYKKQYKLGGKVYDFYIPSYNLLIEIDGDYWHGNKKTNKDLNGMQKKNRINDQKKNRIAKNNGYRLLRFWESDIKKYPFKVFIKLKKVMRL